MGALFGIDTLILQALIGREGYGLEIAERVEKMTKGATKLGPGRLYPTLRELEKDGFLSSRTGEPMPERGGRPRVYYKLTALGQREAMKDRRVASEIFGLVPAKVPS